MPYAQGLRQFIAIWFEAIFKTRPATVNADKLPVFNPMFKPIRGTFKGQGQTGTYEPRTVVLGKKAVEWSFGVDVNPANLFTACKMLFCGLEQQGTASLFHTRFHLSDLLSMGMQDGHAVLSRFFPFDGMLCGQGGFTFKEEGAMELTLSGVGAVANPAVNATVVNGATVDRTALASISHLAGRIKKAGVKIGYIKTVSLDINRNLSRDSAQDETDSVAVIVPDTSSITGKMTALMETAAVDLYNSGLAGEDTTFEFYVPAGAGQGFWVELTNVKLMPFNVEGSGGGLKTISGAFEAQGNGGNVKGSARGLFFTTLAIGGLTLIFSVDGAADQTVTFTAGDKTPDQAVTEINAQTTGCVARVERSLLLDGTSGFIVIESDTAGASGSIQVKATSTAEVLMGFDVALHAGLSNVHGVYWVANKVAA